MNNRKTFSSLRIVLFWTTVFILGRFEGKAQSLTLDSSTLACSQGSLYPPYVTPLPACSRSGIAYLDKVSFSVSAYCNGCQTTKLLNFVMAINVGLSSFTPCSEGVSWQMSGGVYDGPRPYIGGSLQAVAVTTGSFARIYASMACDNNVPEYTGAPNGTRLTCQ